MAQNLDDEDIDMMRVADARDAKKRGKRADYALADAAVAHLIPPQLELKLLGSVPVNLLIEAPDRDWVVAVHRGIKKRFPRLRGKSFVDTRNPKYTNEDNHIAFLHGGESIVGVSTQVDELVPAPILHSADVVLRLESIDPTIIRKAILEITGKHIRKFAVEDYDGLGFAALAASIRPDTTPAQCRARMIEAKQRMSSSNTTITTPGPTIAELPLVANVRDWADRTLTAMRAMENGTLTVAQAPFTLLGGPPGSGKTHLASAIARSAGWDFVSSSVASWFAAKDGHLGDVAKASAEFFSALGKSKRPIVGLLDELDALPNRKALAERHLEWWAPIITGTLLHIDTLRQADRPVLLLAASNFPERLDDALIRPGRLGDHVMVGHPQNAEEASELFRFYLGEEITGDQMMQLAKFAMASPTLTPAMVSGWIAKARATAIHEGRGLVFTDVATAIVGQESRSVAQLRRIAIHEAGHTIVSLLHNLPVRSVSIIKAPGVEGEMIADFGQEILDRGRVEQIVMALLAGRAADLEILGFTDAGATSDLEAATNLLRESVLRFGLYDRLSVYPPEPFGTDAATRRTIEDTLQSLFVQTRALVVEHREEIERLAERLIEHRVMSCDDLDDVIRLKAS